MPLRVPNVPPPAVATIFVSDVSGVVADLRISVDIRGASICDLSVWLEHPDGSTVDLLAVDHLPPGLGCGQELVTTFPSLTPTPFARDLTSLRGKPANGTWRLHVADEGGSQALDEFSLLSWTVVLTAER